MLLRRILPLLLGIFLFFLILALPLSLKYEAHYTLAVISFVIVWWISEPVPLGLTALLIPVLMVSGRVVGVDEAFRHFTHPVIFLFLGSFILAEAARKHELDFYIAGKVLKVAKGRGRVIPLLMGGIAWFLSMWLSNTATTAMLLPLVYGLMRGVDDRRFMVGFLLLIAYATAPGGMSTPIGTPPNIITLGFLESFLNYRIDFLKWTFFSLPLTLAMFLVLYFGFRFTHMRREYVVREEIQTGPLTCAQRNVLIAISITIFLWVLPGAIRIFFGEELWKKVDAVIPESVSALIGAGLLFLMPVNLKDGKWTVSADIFREIDWNTIFLFGGGLTLGEVIMKSGLGGEIGEVFLNVVGTPSFGKVVFFSTVVAVVMTEFMSNTASANLIVPIVISICNKVGISPLIPSIAACYSTSLAFLLPISTPPNAIVYSTGIIRIWDMVKAGLIFDVAGIILINGWAKIMHSLGVL